MIVGWPVPFFNSFKHKTGTPDHVPNFTVCYPGLCFGRRDCVDDMMGHVIFFFKTTYPLFIITKHSELEEKPLAYRGSYRDRNNMVAKPCYNHISYSCCVNGIIP